MFDNGNQMVGAGIDEEGPVRCQVGFLYGK